MTHHAAMVAMTNKTIVPTGYNHNLNISFTVLTTKNKISIMVAIDHGYKLLCVKPCTPGEHPKRHQNRRIVGMFTYSFFA